MQYYWKLYRRVTSEAISYICYLPFLGFGHSGVTGSLASRTYDTATAATSASTSGSSGYSSTPGSSKGLSFKEVLAALVLITRGTHEEKIKCKYTKPCMIK